jgi:alcohol dehydrogenase
MLVPLPGGFDPVSLISVADMALDSWRAVGPHLQQRPGARVLVVGGSAAVIGLYAAAIALAMGASDVLYLDASDERRIRARFFGARVAAHHDEADGLFDIIVDACGDAALLKQTIARAAPEAVLTSVTIYPADGVSLPLREMYWPIVRPPMEHVLGLCHAGAFKPDAVPAKVFSFEEAPEAWMAEDLRTAVSRL